MEHVFHLSDEVEIVTDRFASQGVHPGAVGIIVDDWADGSNDVEVADPKTGDVIARVRAAENEIRPHTGEVDIKEPRKHGILFGRGDELAPGTEAPPMPTWMSPLNIPGYAPDPIAFSQPPSEEVKVEGDVPWELRDEPPTGPILH